MVKLTTKTIASLLLVTAATLVPHIGRKPQNDQSQLDRTLQRHDRKGELRAAILGMSSIEFREQHKKQSFQDIIRQHGFKNEAAFRLALFGKLRDELLRRGWSRQKIERHVHERNERMNQRQNVVY